MQLRQQLQRNLPIIIATVVIGVIVGTSSALLSLFLDHVEHLFLGFQESNRMPVNLDASAIHRGLSVIAGGILAGFSWYLLQKKGYRPVELAKAVEGQRMPLFRTLAHVLTQIFFVGTGGSIGRELAPREAGAAFAQKWEDFANQHPALTLEDDDKRLLVAAAAGAGFAGVYIAPITGAFFCMELLYKRITPRAIAVSLTMSSIATMIGALVKGYVPYYLVSDRELSLRLLPYVIVVAPLMGWLGHLFGRAIKACSAKRPHQVKLLVLFPIVGLVTGLVAAVYPQIMGNGRGLAQLAMSTTAPSRIAIVALFFGLVAKPIVTLMTIRFGGYGGVLTPSISIGASLGVLLGMVYAIIVPGIPLAQFAVVGAVAFLTSLQTAPLMALFMLFEVCHLASGSFLMLALAAGLSIAVNKWLSAASN